MIAPSKGLPQVEFLIPASVLIMCLVLTWTARTDRTHHDDVSELATGWLPPGDPSLGPNELDGETDEIPAVVE